MIRRKKRPSLIVPTSSMGDIAFLLIIFFMLASTFMKSANITAEHASSENIEQQDSALVSITVDADGKIWYQGQECSSMELESLMAEYAQDHTNKPVHVLVDKNQPRKVYMPVIQAISASGAKMVLTGDPEEN